MSATPFTRPTERRARTGRFTTARKVPSPNCSRGTGTLVRNPSWPGPRNRRDTWVSAPASARQARRSYETKRFSEADELVLAMELPVRKRPTREVVQSGLHLVVAQLVDRHDWI
jgi:hypothetical protein